MFDFSQIDQSLISLSQAQSSLGPLLILICGIVIYSIFIFKFYHFIAQKNVFKLDLQKYSSDFIGFIKKIFSTLLFMLEYLILLPVIIFFWFVVIAFMLSLLSKTESGSTVMLISMAMVAATRVLAYYNEELTVETAKILPFSLLGVFLLDMGSFSLEQAKVTLLQFPSYWQEGIYYLGFCMLLEWFLRISTSILSPLLYKEEK
jgi:hypothetical protein